MEGGPLAPHSKSKMLAARAAKARRVTGGFRAMNSPSASVRTIVVLSRRLTSFTGLALPVPQKVGRVGRCGQTSSMRPLKPILSSVPSSSSCKAVISTYFPPCVLLVI